MRILFSPSESKSQISPHKTDIGLSLWRPELFPARLECIKIYDEILREGDESELKKLFGLKNIDAFAFRPLRDEPTQKAVLRYAGVAYAHLDYESLDKSAREFIDKNTLIFSNLLGPILAGDKIPNYKLKQSEDLRGLKPELHYQKTFKEAIDEWLGDELIVDLRAAFYEKFYQLKKPHISMKFYKNGKILSHFAKAYRGISLRYLAINRPENTQDFERINFENLHIKEIKKMGLKTEYSFEIRD